jgi:hypothetical protein
MRREANLADEPHIGSGVTITAPVACFYRSGVGQAEICRWPGLDLDSQCRVHSGAS